MIDWAERRQTQRTGRRVLLILAAVSAVVLLLCLGFTPVALNSFMGGDGQGNGFGIQSCAPIELAVDGVANIKGLSKEQAGNAAMIIAAGQRLRVPPRGWVIAVATAMQESSLRNINHGDRAGPDSRGLFQQRAGWGALAERMNPAIAAELFYTGGRRGQRGLTDIPGWQLMRLTDAAQAVQISGKGGAYQKWEPMAIALVNRLSDGAAAGVAAAAGNPARCAGPGEISESGWTVPSAGNVGSGFRTRSRPGHNGVDIIAGRGRPIHAAAAGLVITSVCNSSGGCAHDGSPAVKGCGWYVDIRHAAGFSTRYCHMNEKPLVSVGDTVNAGTQLGVVGSTGNSSGPHLHFEVRINGEPIDPIPFMTARGAPLGGRQ